MCILRDLKQQRITHMIEGPDPTYFMEYDGTPEELTKLMKMADDEEDLIQDWLELPVPRRKVLWSRLQAFLEKPPTDTQLLELAWDRGDDSTEAEILKVLQKLCRRLELSLQESA